MEKQMIVQMIINSQNLNTIKKKEKYQQHNVNPVIEFIANTNNEIQIWVIKTCYKLYTHKTREHRILKTQMLKMLKMLKPKKTH